MQAPSRRHTTDSRVPRKNETSRRRRRSAWNLPTSDGGNDIENFNWSHIASLVKPVEAHVPPSEVDSAHVRSKRRVTGRVESRRRPKCRTPLTTPTPSTFSLRRRNRGKHPTERRPTHLLLTDPLFPLAFAPAPARDEKILHRVCARLATLRFIREDLQVLGSDPQRLVQAGLAVEVHVPSPLDVVERVAVSAPAVERGLFFSPLTAPSVSAGAAAGGRPARPAPSV